MSFDEDIYQRTLDFWFSEEISKRWFTGMHADPVRRTGPARSRDLGDIEIDKIIKDKFGYIFEPETEITTELVKPENMTTLDRKCATIIILDQFTRNIFRLNRAFDSFLKWNRQALQITNEIIETGEINEFLLDASQYSKLIFCLMPLRHTKRSTDLDKIMRIIERIGVRDKNLEKFRYATLKSYTELIDRIEISESREEPDSKELDFEEYKDILDEKCFMSHEDCDARILVVKNLEKIMLEFIGGNRIRKIGISLSGGVDSMVIAYILKTIPEIETYAMHIEYNNREESEKETELIRRFCNQIGLTLFVQKVKHMSRDKKTEDTEIEREFYESETTKIRFNTYKWISENYGVEGFCMGHHAGDIGENVMMNIFTGRDILDLSVMHKVSEIMGTKLFRPFLEVTKDKIFEYAKINKIPFLKDSTPEWSCRGVLRREIMPLVSKQFGSGVYTKLRELSDKSGQWNAVIEKHILEPFIRKIRFAKLGCYFSLSGEEELFTENVFWFRILIHVFHKLNTHMISTRNLEYFVEKIKSKALYDGKRFIFSNGYSCMIQDDVLYIIGDIEKSRWTVEIKELDEDSPMSRSLRESKREIIKIEQVLNGFYSYTECSSKLENLKEIKVFESRDSTRKIFSKIGFLRDSVIKITSGFITLTRSGDYKNYLLEFRYN